MPNMPYPQYNMNPYQQTINQQNQIQQNQIDNQKNYQNQMGLMNPNNPMMKQPQMQPPMQPQFQNYPPYQNNPMSPMNQMNQMTVPKQINPQAFNKQNNGTNNEALQQQQRNFKDPNVPVGVPGNYQVPQQPFVPVNPNLIQNQGGYNTNIQGQVPQNIHPRPLSQKE